MTLPGIELRALPAGTAFVRAVALHAKHGDNIRAALDEARKYPDTPQVERYFEM